MNRPLNIFFVACITILFSLSACKSKRKLQDKNNAAAAADTTNDRCKLDFKNAKALTKYIKENELSFDWMYTKANVESNIDGKEESFDIKVRIRKDSAMLVSIQYLLGIEVAKVLITKDSVKMVIYPKKQYFRGDFNYINELLHADLDFDLLQAVLFGNSAEFHHEDEKLKPVTDRQNCRYLLSTERKRKLKKITQGHEPKKSLQVMSLDPVTFKILKNEFIDIATNRIFTASYDKYYDVGDSVYTPRHVNIDIVAEKKVSLKIDYVRVEKNIPQKISINIPPKYDPISVNKKP